MLSGALLDNDDRGVARALASVGCLLASLLLVALAVPVLVLTSLVHAPVSAPAEPVQQVAGVVLSVTRPPAQSSSGSAEAVPVAERYLGVPYVFGGTNPAVGLDCSGLVQLVYRQLGIGLPRTAQQQYNATSRLTREQLQPGDLVFFARTYADPNDWVTHVGIYIGNGQQINAPTEGQVVSIQPVFTGFWGDHFVGGGRVAGR